MLTKNPCGAVNFPYGLHHGVRCFTRLVPFDREVEDLFDREVTFEQLKNARLKPELPLSRSYPPVCGTQHHRVPGPARALRAKPYSPVKSGTSLATCRRC